MSTPTLYDILSKKLEQKRKGHPSFKLMKIDDKLFPDGIIKFDTEETEALDSKDKLKTVKKIIAESWKKGKNNHLMIEGEGGLGKTVTLLSIPEKFTPFHVPAIYIPLHELTENDDPIEHYIKKRILKNKEDLLEQLLNLIDQPWDKGPRLLLLLDGFNEIAAEKRKIISEDLEHWSVYPGIQIITSSRYDIHTYVTLSYDYSAIKLQPLSNKTVNSYLDSIGVPMPINDVVMKLITNPLLLTLYVKTELILRQRETDFSDFREVKNAGSIVWNYLQCELWRFEKEEEIAKNAILTMEFIAPFIAWGMQQKSLFVLEKKEFNKLLENAYKLLKSHFNKPDDFPLHIQEALQNVEGIPPLELIKNLLEKHLCLFIKNKQQYRLMHQQFRDALTAVHLINSCYLSGNNLPQEWESPIDYYVMQFVADLIREDTDKNEALKLWEQNRRASPAIEDSTRNQLRLQGLLHNNDFSHLNFSGLDLNNISLFPYRVNNTLLKVPADFNNLEKVKLSERTFSAEGHESDVNCIAITTDGKRIVSGSKDNTIRVWDLETGDQIRVLVGHEDEVKAVTITQDGRFIISGSWDKTIRIWDLESGTQLGEPLEGHEDAVNAVAITRDGTRIISGSWDHTIRIWDFKSRRQIKKTSHKSVVSSIFLTPDGKRIISGSWDNTIGIWNYETSKPVFLEGHQGNVLAIAVTPDGKCVVSGSNDKTIRVWDLATDNPTGQLLGKPNEGHRGSVLAITVTQDERIISGSGDKTIRIWDLKTMMQIGNPIEKLPSFVNSIAVTPDCKRIISGSSDSIIRIWDLETRTQIGKPIKGHSNSIDAVSITPDGKRIISRSSDNTIRIWDLSTKGLIGKPIENYDNSLYTIAVTPDGKRVVRSLGYSIIITDLETGDLIGKPLAGYRHPVDFISLTSDGKRIVSRSRDNTIHVWDLGTQSKIGEPIEGLNDSVFAVAVTPNGKCIISGSMDKTIRIWDLETGMPICKPIEGHSSSVDAVAVTPDGKHIVTGSKDKTIRIWNLETGSSIGKPIEGFIRPIDAVIITPNGKRLICKSRDYGDTIRIIDLEDRVIIKTIIKTYGSLAEDITPDGKQLISGFKDGTIRITNVDTEEIETIQTLPLSVAGLDFTLAEISTPGLKKNLRQNGAIV